MQMATSHSCTEFSYDVLCIIGTYLNVCVKTSLTASVLDPGGLITPSFQYMRDKLSHGRYVGRPLPPSLQNLLATWESEREMATRRDWELVPVPAIVGLVDPGVGQGGAAPPAQHRGGGEGDPCPKPFPIQYLRLLTGGNTCGVCRNVTLPI